MAPTASCDQRLLRTLEKLLDIPTGDVRTTFTQVADLIAQELEADKIDVFLYDSTRDSLVAVCSSSQPLSALQRKLGLEVLPIVNGGRVVYVYKTGKTFVTGNLTADPEELRGVKEGLKIESKLGVPLEIAGERRGMVMIASLKRDFFNDDDVRYAERLVRWVGMLAHRAELAETMRRNAVEQGRRLVAEELIAVVSHDVRNYLTPIHLRLETIRGLAAQSKNAEILDEVQLASKALAHLRGMVSDLLDAARIEHGLFRIDAVPLDLAAVVRESADALRTPDVRIDVRVQSTGTIMVAGEAARLRQCVDNLIANAVEHSPKGGTVTLAIGTESHTDGERATVEVIDEGPGVPPEVLPRIFERWVTDKRQSGGLGLYLAKRIAAEHGGDLTVQSEPGKGARFRLTLPCRVKQDGGLWRLS